MEGSCHCGAVRFEVASRPTHVAECNCSICGKLGTLWSYYHPRDVRFVTGAERTRTYVWGDRTIAFHGCGTCGCTTHWAAIGVSDPDRMGINARLLDGVHRDNVEMRHVDCGEHGRFWFR